MRYVTLSIVFFNFILFVIDYYGITQDPITKDFMIIMDYYPFGDLAHYLVKGFYNWYEKLNHLIRATILSLERIHKVGIIHRDLHSGNILLEYRCSTRISDLGLSKSATELIIR